MWRRPGEEASAHAHTVTRRRVLFVAEAVTLTHAARPVELARTLDPSIYDVVLAWDPRYARLFPPLPFPTHEFDSLSGADFNRSLRRGSPPYDVDRLRRDAVVDREIVRRVRPDLIVGDSRLSLPAVAAVEGVPFWNLANGYWSPYFQPGASFPGVAPDHPLVRIFGTTLGDHVLCPLFFPRAAGRYADAVNDLRRDFGLSSLGRDVRRIYTVGDRTLYLDPPGLFPLEGAPPTHDVLGWVDWSPDLPWPPTMDATDDPTPRVYVTLGTSGGADLLPSVIKELGKRRVRAVLAGAGEALPSSIPPDMTVADFLPGRLACAWADLVICNGGASTGYQALAEGVPIIGIAGNLDQMLFMRRVEGVGAGIWLRTPTAARTLGAAIDRALVDRRLKARAEEVQRDIRSRDARERFRTRVDEFFQGRL
jgi:UDP:flavonoid glycosyltransferase YjiC (YdhE family)